MGSAVLEELICGAGVQIMNMLEARAPSEDKFKKMLAGWVFEGSTQNKGGRAHHEIADIINAIAEAR